MKLVMDEKLKHRLIGLAVIFSLGAIFAPAIMKKSNQSLDRHVSVQVILPPKPSSPDVVASNEEELFKTITIARAKIKAVPETSQLSELVKAESLTSLAKADIKEEFSPMHLAINEGATHSVKKMMKDLQPISQPKVALNQKTAPIPTKSLVHTNIKVVNPKISAKLAKNIKKESYAIQLASFSQLSNAQSLVSKLQTKGYKANYVKSGSRSGSIYKVIVGHSYNKPEIMKLKNQLASAMQLKGFVVTEVGNRA